MKCDVLIVGSGAAGLSLALKLGMLSPQLSIVITTKTQFKDSNTALAQGGVAAVMDFSEDSIQKHIEDTLIAGDGLCDEEAVRQIVQQGPERIRELISWGWKADQRHQKLDLAREGGHSAHRVVHQKDQSGISIVEVLLDRVKSMTHVTMLQNRLSIDLLMNEGQCIGATFMNTEIHSFENIYAGITVLATGGAGQVYPLTTNPYGATGDGVAMAQRAGACISNMEFVQFHPTAFAGMQNGSQAFLISEAVRGAGGILRNTSGMAFMELYDQRGSLAPRDVVSRAIEQEIRREGSEHMYLDCRHFKAGEFKNKFPNIYRNCMESGIDPETRPIPVAPAAHYMCGGIETDLSGRTSIEGLTAIGECACTGLHGANRLASNSLLEAIVLAHNAASSIVSEKIPQVTSGHAKHYFEVNHSDDSIDLDRIEMEISSASDTFAGIIRTDPGINRGLRTVLNLQQRIANYRPTREEMLRYQRVRNLACIAFLILQHSQNRKVNAGGFYKVQDPELSVG